MSVRPIAMVSVDDPQTDGFGEQRRKHDDCHADRRADNSPRIPPSSRLVTIGHRSRRSAYRSSHRPSDLDRCRSSGVSSTHFLIAHADRTSGRIPLTPEAAKLYNRSQRALERDLDVALATEDQDVLTHYKLVTKDGEERIAENVSTEAVKKLVTDGMAPVWYVEEAWLEETYGRKGAPNPQKKQPSNHGDSRGLTSDPTETEEGASEKEQTPDPVGGPPSDYIRSLEEQVRTLKREKEQEIERHDQVVEKLFKQLDVKDKQISAWDEVTQTITKGLATGQLVPMLAQPAPPAQTDAESDASNVVEADIVASDAAADEGTTKPRGKAPSSRHKKSTSKRTPEKKASSSAKKSALKKKDANFFTKHTPTLHKAFSKLSHR